VNGKMMLFKQQQHNTWAKHMVFSYLIAERLPRPPLVELTWLSALKRGMVISN
jgi:hypothetical protein